MSVTMRVYLVTTDEQDTREGHRPRGRRRPRIIAVTADKMSIERSAGESRLLDRHVALIINIAMNAIHTNYHLRPSPPDTRPARLTLTTTINPVPQPEPPTRTQSPSPTQTPTHSSPFSGPSHTHTQIPQSHYPAAAAPTSTPLPPHQQTSTRTSPPPTTPKRTSSPPPPKRQKTKPDHQMTGPPRSRPSATAPGGGSRVRKGFGRRGSRRRRCGFGKGVARVRGRRVWRMCDGGREERAGSGIEGRLVWVRGIKVGCGRDVRFGMNGFRDVCVRWAR